MLRCVSDKDVLDEIIDSCKLQRLDKGLTRPMLLLLLYDLLFGSQRIEGGGHYKRLVLQNRTPIQSALARIYIKRHAASPSQLLPPALRPRPPHPRYVRINTLLCSQRQAIEALQTDGWTEVERPSQQPTAMASFVFPSSRSFYRDVDIDGLLLVFPPSSTFHASALYEKGWLVLQDKASCMSAVCLNPAVDEVVVDGCAAPGNKTSHLLAIIADKAKQANGGRVTGSVDAFEVHQQRFTLLTRLLGQKGVHVAVDCGSGCHPSQGAVESGRGRAVVTAHHASFLSLKSDDGLGRRVTAVLLDPTCSGSGMTHTLDAYYKEKNREAAEHEAKTRETGHRERKTETQTGKKRKRMTGKRSQLVDSTGEREKGQRLEADEGSDEQERPSSSQARSLSLLSAFQTSLLVHSFSLPSVRHIVYSTCSVHVEENEAVIAAALSHSGREKGWEVEAGLLPHWKRRGRQAAVAGLSEAECERMVRCEADEDCMNGFFVCGLVRRTGDTPALSTSEAQKRKESELAAAGDVQDGSAVDAVDGLRERAADRQWTQATEQQTESKKKKKKKKKKKRQKVVAVPPS